MKPLQDQLNYQQILKTSPPPLFSKPDNLGLLWSAKSGCTFAVKWFFFQIGMLDTALSYNRWIHHFRSVFTQSEEHQQYFVSEESIKNLLTDDMHIIKVVRNPYHRAVSSYLHVIRYMDRMPTIKKQMRTFFKRRISPETTLSFREFTSFLVTRNIYKTDIHFKPQRHDSEKYNIITPTYIVKLEDSATILEQIETELKLKKSDFNLLRQSSHHNQRLSLNIENCSDKYFTRKELMNCDVPPTANFYDKSLLSIIANLYEVDFHNYGYSPDIL